MGKIERAAKLEHAHKATLRASALKAQGGLCVYCFEPLKYKNATADHIHPRIKGGLITQDNIAAACKPCNKLKGSMSVGKFRNMLKCRSETAQQELRDARWRRRFWLKVWRAQCRILASVGLPKIELPDVNIVQSGEYVPRRFNGE